MHKILSLICLLLVMAPSISLAQGTLHQDLRETVKAKVLDAGVVELETVPGTDTDREVQEITVEILEGSQAGRIVSFENEIMPLKNGEHIFVNYLITVAGDEFWILMDIDRRAELVLLVAIFAVLLVWFAGVQGLRSLMSLALSIGAIIFLLIPALLRGWDPALASLGIASVILGAVLFGTHGFKPRITIAFFGTYAAVLVTCLIAYVFVTNMRLSGLSSDEAVFLNFATSGILDFSGLLLGSIIIGILGVLDDVSITQASIVQELKAANNSFGPKELYRRAIRVGRDHVGSLVNTLALAYVGAALPLVLLFARADTSWTLSVNQEIIAAEIARIIIGSIGLILAVPFTTLLAAWYFGKQDSVAEEEMHHCGHHHSH